jgi:multidrug efflux system membrane fusion protein
MKRVSTTLILILVLAVGFWWQGSLADWIAGQVPAAAPYLGVSTEAAPSVAARIGRNAPVPVNTAQPQEKNLPNTIDAVGTAKASASVAIQARIDSQLAAVNVAEGAKVEKGEILFHLDDRTVRAVLDSMEAQIAKDEAQIAQAQLDLQRASSLLATNAGSKVTRDTANTAVKVAQAQLLADQAQKQAAETNLSYTIIRAPITGRIGSIPVKVGSIVRNDSAALTTINRLDPIQVKFAIPQAGLPDLRAAMAKGPVEAEVSFGKATLKGTVAFIENTIDDTTGTITVTANVPNQDEVIWPGAFVNVRLILPGPGPMVTVPSEAVQLGQNGSYLFAINGDTAELRQIKVLDHEGKDVVVAEGVKSGEQVVVQGQLRLTNGAKVTIESKPAAETAAREG